ncbi:MAG TPA: hypothetical protein VFY29_05215 [Terriglobia bacterium]|nr:hypothetical protein [Terriglobia bacterium]
MNPIIDSEDRELAAELEAALRVEPGPEFLPRCRARIEHVPAPPAWSLARLWVVPAIAAAMAAAVLFWLQTDQVYPPSEPMAPLAHVDTSGVGSVESAPPEHGPQNPHLRAPIAKKDVVVPGAAAVDAGAGARTALFLAAEDLEGLNRFLKGLSPELATEAIQVQPIRIAPLIVHENVVRSLGAAPPLAVEPIPPFGPIGRTEGEME